jgi:phosphoglycolate phosphatase-like HAD superfamily hydrolase
MQQTPILLYDIDGTLLNVHRDFILSIIHEQFEQHGIEKEGAESRSFAGRTDRGIFMEFIGDSPGAEQMFESVMESYSLAMRQRLTRDKMHLHNGAVESVYEAVSLNIPVGLCTGNIRPVAMTKVQTAGFEDTFLFGGFGDSSADRNELPGQADRAYRAVYDEAPRPEQYVVIGDTPNDIRCARHFGAKSVAVTTGGFSAAELGKHNPDLVLDTLDDTRGWLGRLGFSI